jgi:hypothetical protein
MPVWVRDVDIREMKWSSSRVLYLQQLVPCKQVQGTTINLDAKNGRLVSPT